MEWAILYHTDGPFEEIVNLLKHHGYSPEVFYDPHCHEVYVPGAQPDPIKCRQHFYIAVPREQCLNAEGVVKSWTQETQQEYKTLKKNTFGKAVQTCFFSFLIFAVCCIVYPDLLNADNYDNVATVIIILAVLWTGIFFFLISKKKRPSPKTGEISQNPNKMNQAREPDMGLELVELVFIMEETFRIQIKDTDLEYMRTVGQMHECICGKFNTMNANVCPIQQAFYALRKNIAGLTNSSKREIRPKTRTEQYFPKDSLKKQWALFSEQSSLVLPPLDLPTWIKRFLLLSSAAVAMSPLLFFVRKFHMFDGAFFVLLCLIALASLLLWALIYQRLKVLFRPHLFAIPASCATIGGFSKQILKLNSEKFDSPFTEDEVWNKLVDTISEHFGVKREDIKPETRFIGDLDFG